jgi:hypothetical protein
MPRVIRFLLFTTLFAVMAVTGCISTQIQTDWKDSAFHGTFKKVLVVCVAKQELVRTTLEDDMAAQFTQRGIEAIQSYKIFPVLRDVDKEMVKRKAREMNADGVFAVRTVRHEINSYYSYDDMLNYVNAEDQPLTAEYYRVQIGLYDSSRGAVVWQALSDTFIGGAWTATIKEFARVMGAKLIEHKLI